MRTLLAGLLALLMAPAFAACPPEGQTADSLKQLKALKFQTSDANDQKKLAMGLLDCLGDPDPVMRDDIAYEALTAWMRAGAFDADTLRAMRDALYAQLDGDDPQGFRKPYAALVLSEVARTDRLKPWMTAEERAAMVEKAAGFLEGLNDYRAFDDKEGWRHGVAHGSDWLMQLALNTTLERAQTDRILAAVAVQVVPDAAPAYAAGEPGRLARPVIYIAQRGIYTQKDWDGWFGKLVPRIGDPALAYNDSHWLARRHDLMAFLMSLYIEADQSDDPNIHFLKPSIVETVKKVP
ncbi:MAG TPA: DUF2785 domain-containing protein [Xanthomonadaceae bacterium]|jgi:hypothetical protein